MKGVINMALFGLGKKKEEEKSNCCCGGAYDAESIEKAVEENKLGKWFLMGKCLK